MSSSDQQPSKTIEGSVVSASETVPQAASAPGAEPGSATLEPAVVAKGTVPEPDAVVTPATQSPVALTPAPAEATPASATPTPASSVAIVSPPPEPIKRSLDDRLPNASVGKPYSYHLNDWLGDLLKKPDNELKFEPQGSGLTLDVPNATLHGTPTSPGEFKILISLHVGLLKNSSHTFALTVNPNPSSLWKNLPSDKGGAFAKPDTDTRFLETPDLTVMAASLRGRSHAHEGKYREDDFGLRFIEATGWHILISADGAGYAKFARRGSQLACQTALAVIEEKLGNEEYQLNAALSKLGASTEAADLEKLRLLSHNVLMLAAHQAHSAIHKQSKESQATPRDFASTFIVVIARRVGNRWFLASFAIGDGGAGALLHDGSLIPLMMPDSGDFAGQTVFITMPQVFSDPAAGLLRTRAKFCPSFKFLAVMSDGITDPIFQCEANQADAIEWEKWRQQLPQNVSLDAPTRGMEAALLDYLNFPSPGNHDDRTLLIAVPTPAKT